KKATMTATLMMANQNSNSPNPRTAPKLTTAKNTTATSAGIHGSTPNQPPRIAAAPVISAPITMMSMNQYNQPIVKRAQLPNACTAYVEKKPKQERAEAISPGMYMIKVNRTPATRYAVKMEVPSIWMPTPTPRNRLAPMAETRS